MVSQVFHCSGHGMFELAERSQLKPKETIIIDLRSKGDKFVFFESGSVLIRRRADTSVEEILCDIRRLDC